MSKDPHNALHDAVKNGDFEKVGRLVDEGADVNAPDQKFGLTPLHYVALLDYRSVFFRWKDRTEIARLLIERGADVNALDNNGLTPLCYLVALDNKATFLFPLNFLYWKGRTETAALIIERGADVNARNRYNLTPLNGAHPFPTKMKKLLIQQGGVKGRREKSSTGDSGSPKHSVRYLDANGTIVSGSLLVPDDKLTLNSQGDTSSLEIQYQTISDARIVSRAELPPEYPVLGKMVGANRVLLEIKYKSHGEERTGYFSGGAWLKRFLEDRITPLMQTVPQQGGKLCTNCGNKIEAPAEKCTFCGADLAPTEG